LIQCDPVEPQGQSDLGKVAGASYKNFKLLRSVSAITKVNSFPSVHANPYPKSLGEKVLSQRNTGFAIEGVKAEYVARSVIEMVGTLGDPSTWSHLDRKQPVIARRRKYTRIGIQPSDFLYFCYENGKNLKTSRLFEYPD
jgi:hypothetical protein